ncbi:MAG TPA: ABC transporter permease, partial [Devosia sp.]|nr:ABC transporter permease [Devosia sp.]
TEQRDEIFFFVKGDEYTFLGLTFDRHLFGTREGTLYLLGTDLRGRDMLSRIIYGSRVTLTIGLVGVALMVVLGAFVGALSGYIGGFVDMVVQRVIEVFRLFPPIPLWLALAAAVPPQLPSIYVLGSIVIIYGFIQWPGLAREVRGLVLVLRETEFVLASQAAGAGTFWVVRKHLIPSVLPHLLVTATLGVPVVIIFESTLSFFGLGVKPPTISWGLLLQQSQKLEVLSFYPWLLAPAVFLVAAALLFNFVGDGIRDAVDPYS